MTRRENWIWQNYGLLPQQWDALYDQQLGRCAICLITLAEVKKICVDHDHVTGRVRGLLCHGCNVAIGHLQDDPDLLRRAAEYVERLRLISVPEEILSATVVLD